MSIFQQVSSLFSDQIIEFELVNSGNTIEGSTTILHSCSNTMHMVFLVFSLSLESSTTYISAYYSLILP